VSLTDWARRWFGRRRPDFSVPARDADRLAGARAEAVLSAEVLAHTIRNDPAVDARAARAARIHEQNNLGPAFMRVLAQRREA
jgi:hypothetical protein